MKFVSHTHKDLQIKKLWLGLIIFQLLVMSPLNSIVASQSVNSMIDRKFIILLLFGAISFLLAYFCAYKRSGTKYLMICLIMTTFSFLWILFLLFFFKMNDMNFWETITRHLSSKTMTLYAISIPFSIANYWLTYKVWKINKKIQLQLPPKESI